MLYMLGQLRSYDTTLYYAKLSENIRIRYIPNRKNGSDYIVIHLHIKKEYMATIEVLRSIQDKDIETPCCKFNQALVFRPLDLLYSLDYME